MILAPFVLALLFGLITSAALHLVFAPPGGEQGSPGEPPPAC